MSDNANVITVTGEWRKPPINVDIDNRPFYDGLKDHKLMLWHCNECGGWYWPKSYCQNHENEPFAANMEWTESSGKGKIFAFNRHHWAFHPGFKEEVPYVYALIELDEGPLISTTLVGETPDDVHDIGQEVEIVYEDHPDQGFTLPRFRMTEN